MKSCVLFLALMIIHQQSAAQLDKIQTPRGTLTPPALKCHVRWNDESGDSLLESGEKSAVEVQVTNEGAGTARGVAIRLVPVGAANLLRHPSLRSLGDIPSGGSKTAELEVLSSADVPAPRQARFRVEVSDSSGWSTASQEVLVVLSPRPSPGLTFSFVEAMIVGGAFARVQGLPSVPRGDTASIVIRVLNSGSRSIPGMAFLPTLPEATPQVRLVRAHDTLRTNPLNVRERGTFSLQLVVREDYPENAIALGLASAGPGTKKSLGAVSIPVLDPLQSLELSATYRMEKKDYEGAISRFKRVVDQKPGYGRGYFLLGTAYLGALKRPQGVEAIKKAESLGDPDAARWLKEHPQKQRVEYARLTTGPFASFGRGVGLAVLAFSDAQGRTSALTNEVYKALSSNKTVRERFTLYSYSTLGSQKAAMGLGTLDPLSADVQRVLHENEIELAVFGKVLRQNPYEFSIRLMRTADGETLYEGSFLRSENSKALTDMTKFFSEGLQPVYK